MFKKVLNLQARSEVQKRYLSQIRQSTRQLIETANREERRSSRDPGTTQPEDLRAVRILRSSQKAVLNAVELGVSGGLNLDAIRSEGIDRTFSETVVISDLALFMLEEISGSIEALHRK
jgi:hypothetical protein